MISTWGEGRRRLSAIAATLVVGGCSGKLDDGRLPSGAGPDGPTVEAPVDPGTPVDRVVTGEAVECALDELSPPEVYGTKVKTILTGLPLTAEELADLRADPAALAQLVDRWMATPEFDGSLTRLFQTAFQQNELDVDGLTTMLRRNNLNWGRFERPREDLRELTELNVQESFARTALRIVKEGRPFHEVLTTDTYEMTTALVVLHALLERRYTSDADRLVQTDDPALNRITLYRDPAEAPPAEEALDPDHPRFLHFFVPNFEDLCLPEDQTTYEVGPEAFARNDELWFVFSTLIGRPERVFNREANRDRRGNPCQAGNARATPLLSREDFRDWRPVRMVRAFGSNPTTPFYDLGLMRSTGSLTVRSDRVGFFTTLGFFSTWPTNLDNASRVTLNQTLITALGSSFDGNTVADFSPPNLDEQHSDPGTACYGCHQTLDPMRDFFRRSYTFAYGRQDDGRGAAMEPIFVFRGVEAVGDGVRDLGRILADHPAFPGAWVQKMCVHANGAACPEGQELAEVTADFAGHMDFARMLKRLLTSPLVTHASCVEGGTGGLRTISRRDQLCTILSNRLGVADLCGTDTPVTRRTRTQRGVADAVVSVPKDTFARGEPEPIIVGQTGLFTRATREVTCTVVAERAYGDIFGDADRATVIDRLVTQLMGLPEGDPRRDGALAILNDHVDDALEAGESQRVALQSALVVACMSPGVAGLGF